MSGNLAIAATSATMRYVLLNPSPANSIAAVIATLRLPRQPGAHEVDVAQASVGREYQYLLRAVSWLLPMSYILCAAISPLLRARLRGCGQWPCLLRDPTGFGSWPTASRRLSSLGIAIRSGSNPYGAIKTARCMAGITTSRIRRSSAAPAN